SRGVGQKLGRDLAGKDLSAVFLLSDGLRVNGSELVHGISESVPGQTPVTGGLAGDCSRFKETWVIKDGKPVMGYVTAL
ncbi:FIST N-terminal domain-containing protein, partial [Salmonella enterica]|uniref:FIST N-terminal domain-containing protein n=1 Tax=Salmonella enterica TaxID=28901 RepID=UPI003D2BEC8D